MNYNRVMWWKKWVLVWTIWVCLSGCVFPASRRVPDRMDTEPLRYLALGDSYTIGEGVRIEEAYPNQLIAVLRAEGVEMENAHIIARTGWTTDELAEGIQAADLQPPYSLVTLLIGVNNQFRGYDEQRYGEEFGGLLEQVLEFSGNRPECVLVLSIPDWGVTPLASQFGVERGQVAAAIDRFNRVNAAEAEQAGVVYVDITPISRLAAADPSLISDDGLHPSGKMYALWVEQALPAIRNCLSVLP